MGHWEGQAGLLGQRVGGCAGAWRRRHLRRCFGSQAAHLGLRQLRHQARQIAPRLPQRLRRAVDAAEAHGSGAVPAWLRRVEGLHCTKKRCMGVCCHACAHLQRAPHLNIKARSRMAVLLPSPHPSSTTTPLAGIWAAMAGAWARSSSSSAL